MIVTLENGKKYMTTWKHTTPRNVVRGGHNSGNPSGEHGGTKCMIWEFTGRVLPGDETSRPILEKKLIATGESKVFYKDQFSKETGRKVSLQRALNEGRTRITTKPDVIFMDNGLFPENDRKVFWKEYFGRKDVIVPIKLSSKDSFRLLCLLFPEMEEELQREAEKCPESTIAAPVDAIQGEVRVEGQNE